MDIGSIARTHGQSRRFRRGSPEIVDLICFSRLPLHNSSCGFQGVDAETISLPIAAVVIVLPSILFSITSLKKEDSLLLFLLAFALAPKWRRVYHRPMLLRGQTRLWKLASLAVLRRQAPHFSNSKTTSSLTFLTMIVRYDVIREWQAHMDLKRWVYVVCAFCGQNKFPHQVSHTAFGDVDFSLLGDSDIRPALFLRSYDFFLYKRALLHARGLQYPFARGDVVVCNGCAYALDRGRKPVDAISNKMYYAFDSLPADVLSAFVVHCCRRSHKSTICSALVGLRPARFCREPVAIPELQQ
ncbi:hypothetical protein FA95DRAFT_993477 [Auriscalpium vulgare]|uniref:Uncharacterized protein n=1 Tax=Auriscalpium vulgare TaxID=40419 RepID=A0ACB8R6I0_9AGAM|nr:hypothetical protein FA95DRAFT_993477 [Auriscalpium vulgare]